MAAISPNLITVEPSVEGVCRWPARGGGGRRRLRASRPRQRRQLEPRLGRLVRRRADGAGGLVSRGLLSRGETVAERPIAIEVKDLHKSFRVPSHRVDDAEGADDRVHSRRSTTRSCPPSAACRSRSREGEFMGVVGRNGSGKTHAPEAARERLPSRPRADADRRQPGSVHRAGGGLQPEPHRPRERAAERGDDRPDPAAGEEPVRPGDRVRRAGGLRRDEAQELLQRDA